MPETAALATAGTRAIDSTNRRSPEGERGQGWRSARRLFIVCADSCMAYGSEPPRIGRVRSASASESEGGCDHEEARREHRGPGRPLSSAPLGPP